MGNRSSFRKHQMAVIIGLVFTSLTGRVNATETPPPPAETAGGRVLAETVVSATRTEQDSHDVAVTITSISDDDIEKNMPTDIKDALRHEAGVSVRAQPNRASGVFRQTGRGGNEGINIRGLEGDRVLLQTDGVRLPSSYDSGPYFAGRGDYVDMEAYKRIEILRGPSSTQFGSDGLSGAVSFVTKDPKDLLTLGKPHQGSLKLGYNTLDKGWSVVPSYAYAGEQFEAMILASLRDGHESDTKGNNRARNITRTAPNPQDYRSEYLLGKLVFKPATGHRFKLSAENLDRKVDTKALSFLGDPFAAAGLTGVDLEENITRRLFKLDYDYRNADNPFFQIVSASIYRQDSENAQYGREQKATTNSWGTMRWRDTTYEEKAVGGSLQFESNLGQNVTHRIIYGIDASQTEITSLKDGYNSAGAAFGVNKSFPDTDYRLLGVFIQDEINVGPFSIIPGLRYDRFKLDPKADALYVKNNALPPTKLDGDELSPKLGVIWKASPLVNVFAQYSHGFKAPSPTQVNGGVTNLTSANPYVALGNPGLKPETSDSYELGIRGRSQDFRYSAAIFHGKYKDFIASNVLVEENPAPTPDVFKSVNLSKVRIRGLELRGEWAFSRDWSVSGAYAYTHGDSEDDGVKEPLMTVDPSKLVLGLRYDKAGQYGGELTMTAVERKKRNPDRTAYYNPAGYTVFDLTAWYQYSRNLSFNAGIFNVFDRKYYQWADVRSLSPNYAQIEAFSQPGRHAAISMKYQF